MGDYLLLWWIICGFVGCVAGSFKNRKLLGLLLGFLLGPVGCIVILFVSERPEGVSELGLGIWVFLLVALGGFTVFIVAVRKQNADATEQRIQEARLDQEMRLRRLREEEGVDSQSPPAAAVISETAAPTPLYLPRPAIVRKATPSPADTQRAILEKYGDRGR